jgi:hypothetical protein
MLHMFSLWFLFSLVQHVAALNAPVVVEASFLMAPAYHK